MNLLGQLESLCVSRLMLVSLDSRRALVFFAWLSWWHAHR